MKEGHFGGTRPWGDVGWQAYRGLGAMGVLRGGLRRGEVLVANDMYFPISYLDPLYNKQKDVKEYMYELEIRACNLTLSIETSGSNYKPFVVRIGHLNDRKLHYKNSIHIQKMHMESIIRKQPYHRRFKIR